MTTRISAVVVDRQRTVAEALALGLGRVGVTAEAATDLEQAQRAAAIRHMDVALVDLDLILQEGGSHEDPAAGIADWAERLALPLVVLGGAGTGDPDTDGGVLSAAVRAGVRGWVPRSSPLPHLLRVMDGVLREETWIPPRLLTPLLTELTRARCKQDEGARLAATLTARELEVLGLLCSGMTRCAIASELFVSPRTVRTHVQNILAKLDVHSSLAAVALARRAGLPLARPGTG